MHLTLLATLITIELSYGTTTSGMGFAKTLKLSESNWNSAIQTTFQTAKTKVECASLCYYRKNSVQNGLCNAYDYNTGDQSCILASVTFLEDQQPHLTPKVCIKTSLRCA